MDYIFRKDIPIYTQLVEKMIDAIVSGELRPGDKIDSVRDFAFKAGVNPNTMQRALVELENKGLIITNRTSGRSVTEDNKLIEKIKKEILQRKTKEFMESMAKLSLSKKEVIEMINQIGEKK